MKDISYFTSTSRNFEFSHATIRDRLTEMARSYANEVVFVVESSGGLELTYGELCRRVECVSRNLHGMGVRAGDRVAFQLPNSAETIVMLLACVYVGAIAVPVDCSRLAYDLEYILHKADPVVFVLMTAFGGVDLLSVFRHVCPEIDSAPKGLIRASKFPSLRHAVLIQKLWNVHTFLDAPSSDVANLWRFDEIFEENPRLGSTLDDLPQISPHDPAYMLFTVFFIKPKEYRPEI